MLEIEIFHLHKRQPKTQKLRNQIATPTVTKTRFNILHLDFEVQKQTQLKLPLNQETHELISQRFSRSGAQTSCISETQKARSRELTVLDTSATTAENNLRHTTPYLHSFNKATLSEVTEDK